MELTPSRRTGLCYVCGKSTKLPIHHNCGKKIEEQMAERKRKKSKAAAKAGYSSGKIPPFAED